MPSGETHYSFFMKGYYIVIPETIYLLFINFPMAIGVLTGYSFHRWWDNDLDLMGASGCEGRMVNELKILGNIMYGVSSFYGSIFRRNHRSFWTHFPFVSTVIRLLFLFWWLPIPFYTFNWDLHWGEFLFGIGFILGLSEADMIHSLCDYFWTESFFNTKRKNGRNVISRKK